MLCNSLDGWDVGGEWGEVQEGEDIGMHTADPCHCMAETNATL